MGFSGYGVGAKRLITYISKGDGIRWYVTPFEGLRVITQEGELFSGLPAVATLWDGGEVAIIKAFDSFLDAETWAYNRLVERINRRRATLGLEEVEGPGIDTVVATIPCAECGAVGRKVLGHEPFDGVEWGG